jgi:hypothetical protein
MATGEWELHWVLERAPIPESSFVLILVPIFMPIFVTIMSQSLLAMVAILG